MQGSFLDILAAGGIVSHGFDPDTDRSVIGDTAPDSLGMGFAGTGSAFRPMARSWHTPDPMFVGTDSFVIRLDDGVATSVRST